MLTVLTNPLVLAGLAVAVAAGVVAWRMAPRWAPAVRRLWTARPRPAEPEPRAGDVVSLRRRRWLVRAVLTLAVGASVAANVLHAEPTTVGRAIAAWPPVALLLALELISRIPVHRPSLSWSRRVATGAVAGIAAWVSYGHQVAVTRAHGETVMAAHLVPLSVDGLVVVASVCLVELAGQLRATATPAGRGLSGEDLRPSPTAPSYAELERELAREIRLHDTARTSYDVARVALEAVLADPDGVDLRHRQEAAFALGRPQPAPEPEFAPAGAPSKADLARAALTLTAGRVPDAVSLLDTAGHTVHRSYVSRLAKAPSGPVDAPSAPAEPDMPLRSVRAV